MKNFKVGIILSGFIFFITFCSIAILITQKNKISNISHQSSDTNQQQSIIVDEHTSHSIQSENNSNFYEAGSNGENLDTNVDTVDTSTLSSQGITWGPGGQFNEKNQPVSCVTLQQEYQHLGAIFLKDNSNVYLTFDLGYEAGYTQKILDVLKQNNVKATFFLTASYAEKNEDIINQIISDGHSVGNHSFSHPDMTNISEQQATDEVMRVHNILKDKYGYESHLFRFPSGKFSEKTLEIVKKCGYDSVFWSFAYNDWDNDNQPDFQYALDKAISRLHPGAIYLMHPMKTNSDILNDFISEAKKDGYNFSPL